MMTVHMGVYEDSLGRPCDVVRVACHFRVCYMFGYKASTNRHSGSATKGLPLMLSIKMTTTCRSIEHMLLSNAAACLTCLPSLFRRRRSTPSANSSIGAVDSGHTTHHAQIRVQINYNNGTTMTAAAYACNCHGDAMADSQARNPLQSHYAAYCTCANAMVSGGRYTTVLPACST